MEIKHVEENGQGTFKAIEEGKEVGLLAYTWDGGQAISLNHTEVSMENEGKGIGRKLVMEMVGFARQKNLKIFPRCSYAKRVFERTEELRDVLYKS